MDRRIGLSRKVGEKPVALIFANEIGEFVVPAVDFIRANETPLADMNPQVRLVYTFVGEGVAVDDVLGP